MAGKTTTVFTPRQDGVILSYPVYRATKIPAGVLVMINATGYAVNGADTASQVFVGVSAEEADNSGGSDGTIYIKVYTKGVFKFLEASAALTLVGVAAYILYNDEVSVVGTTTNDIICGVFVQYASAGYMWVDIGRRA